MFAKARSPRHARPSDVRVCPARPLVRGRRVDLTRVDGPGDTESRMELAFVTVREMTGMTVGAEVE